MDLSLLSFLFVIVLMSMHASFQVFPFDSQETVFLPIKFSFCETKSLAFENTDFDVDFKSLFWKSKTEQPLILSLQFPIGTIFSLFKEMWKSLTTEGMIIH